MTRSSIWGTGRSLPERVITNADMEKLVDTSDEWITTRTGIKERRQAAPNQSTSTLSIEASRRALDGVSDGQPYIRLQLGGHLGNAVSTLAALYVMSFSL